MKRFNRLMAKRSEGTELTTNRMKATGATFKKKTDDLVQNNGAFEDEETTLD